MGNLIKSETNQIVTTIEVGDLYHDRSTHSNSGFNVYKIKKIENGTYHVEDIFSGKETTMGKDSLENYYVKYTGDVNVDELKSYSDKLFTGEVDINDIRKEIEQTSDNTTTDLVRINTKEYYELQQQKFDNLRKQIILIEGITQNRITTLMNNIGGISKYLKKTIEKIEDVVFTLTLYGGLSENIIQISSGKTSNDKSIHLIQKMKFMDEEVGDPENGGVSYDSVDKFYDWLKKDNTHLGYKNYELILPYEKSIGIMRVRRDASEEYAKDRWQNIYHIAKEMKTCILFRNGENVYVIHSDMHFQENLFPDQDELERLMNDKYGWRDESEKKLNKYRHGMVLIQGIFDRTSYMSEPGTINVMKGDDLNNGKIIFEYQKIEIEMHDDLKKFVDWIKQGQNISEGSLILFNSFGNGYGVKSRVTKYYRWENRIPCGPDSGIIVKIEKHSGYSHTFLYLPDSGSWGDERKKKERVFIDKTYDRFINISNISRRDYDFIISLLYDRKYRRDYIWLVNIINEIKEFVFETEDKEKHFRTLINQVFPNMSDSEISDYVFWWKSKNKWKRVLSEDDDKAYRMIVKKINSDVKNGTKLEIPYFFDVQ